MGYNIEITRCRDRWDENNTASITLAEWAETVAADPHLEKIAAQQVRAVTVDGGIRYLAVRSEPFDGPDWSGMAQIPHPRFPESETRTAPGQ